MQPIHDGKKKSNLLSSPSPRANEPLADSRGDPGMHHHLCPISFISIQYFGGEQFSDGSNGRDGTPGEPPYGPKFSHFHAVFGEIWQNRMLAPPSLRVGAPSCWKSLIRPCSWIILCWNSTFGARVCLYWQRKMD